MRAGEDWADPSLREEPRQVQERGRRSPEEEQVQVLWQAEDLRQQEVWLHQVEPRRIPGDEGRRPPEDRRCQREVHARARTPLCVVQDSDGARWTLSLLKFHQPHKMTSDVMLGSKNVLYSQALVEPIFKTRFPKMFCILKLWSSQSLKP